jgi:mono/diheme cytochrome c family protein
LACHIHDGTNVPLKMVGKPEVPAIHGEAQFGPNLSLIAAKLGTKPGDVESARRWLIQWIMNPNIHFPRTRMPITHLDVNEANDVAAWLLSQKADWKAADIKEPDRKVLSELGRVFLSRAYTKREVEKILAQGFSPEELKQMQKPLDADERELETTPGEARSMDNKLKMYIGKKAIGQLGCYGCHDIPGFENAKPIGTPLNDWGKKDPERLAFEDVSAYVRKNYQAVTPRPLTQRQLGRLTQLAEKEKKGEPLTEAQKTDLGRLRTRGDTWKSKDGKPAYEQYFKDLLDHHQREGFLYQKLSEPRSFDYERLRAWDDRLRMPQFRFARTEPIKGESKEEYEARQEQEEADAREAVMTFILGLVAEPVPPKYIHQPDTQRLAEAKGRQVLDKFNCAGCHLVRPGVYDFKSTDETLKSLVASYDTAKGTFGSDHFFADSNAWNGLPQPRPDRLRVFGLRKEYPAREEGQPPDQLVFLTEALRFTVPGEEGKSQSYNIPAWGTIALPRKLISSADNFGGTFGDLLVGYLMQKDKQRYGGGEDKARPSVPPALIREGEKTQPDWLFRFLRNPEVIRPVTVLRMPKFNMSDEDAMTLVNYFSAADKVGNPAAGLSYPYFTILERDETYIQKKTAQYIQSLKKSKEKDASLFDQELEKMKPIWEEQLQRQRDDLQILLQAKEAELKKAEAADPKKKPEEIKTLQDERDALRKDVEKADELLKKKDIGPQRRRWEEKEAYLIDGFRLLTSLDICRNCHQVGNLLPKEQQGPHLSLTWQRLRPEWTLRWLANPQRFMTYPTPMPQNFSRSQSQWQDLFHGSSIEQATAARDALMNYPQLIDLPANRQRPAVVAGAGGK